MTQMNKKSPLGTIGVIGGTGWMGEAIIKQMLALEYVAPSALWVSNRSGVRTEALKEWPQIHFTQHNTLLVEHCDTILLSVRPQDFPALSINARNKLVVSVMAGVTINRMAETIFAQHIVRAMPNAAAEIGMSYTPWYASFGLDFHAAQAVQELLETFGKAHRMQNEDQIDFFTALTGSGQGWVAFFQKCLVQSAVNHGISNGLAEQAVRQLFLGMGTLLAQSQQPLDRLLTKLIDYAGTTAAGLLAFESSKVLEEVVRAIEVSYNKARSDMSST